MSVVGPVLSELVDLLVDAEPIAMFLSVVCLLHMLSAIAELVCYASAKASTCRLSVP